MDSVAQLDRDIATLRSRILETSQLREHLQSTLLSAQETLHRLQQQTNNNFTEERTRRAREVVAWHGKHNMTINHQIAAGVTGRLIRDPDFNSSADSNGSILAIRIEAPIGSRFSMPYFIFLRQIKGLIVETHPVKNDKNSLEVIHHTIPKAIPLLFLAKRHLPLPCNGSTHIRQQNLLGFVRAVRQEIVSWTIRKRLFSKGHAAAIGGLEPNTERNQEFLSHEAVTDIISDHAVRFVDIRWEDGNSGRIQVTRTGALENVVVRGQLLGQKRATLTSNAHKIASH